MHVAKQARGTKQILSVCFFVKNFTAVC